MIEKSIPIRERQTRINVSAKPMSAEENKVKSNATSAEEKIFYDQMREAYHAVNHIKRRDNKIAKLRKLGFSKREISKLLN